MSSSTTVTLDMGNFEQMLKNVDFLNQMDFMNSNIMQTDEKFLPTYGEWVHVTGDTICHIFNDKNNLCLRSPNNIWRTRNFAGDPILTVKLMDNWRNFFDLT